MAYFKYKSSNVFYRKKGQGDLLIIVPGNTAASVMHRNELAYFGKNYHAVSLDLLGTGQSDRLERWTDDWWKEGAHQVKALIDYLGYEHAILVGTSGGAVIALLCAITYSEKVKAVIADSFSEKFSEKMLLRNVIKERDFNDANKAEFWKFAHGDDWQRVVSNDTEIIKQLVEKGGEWLENRVDEIKCPVLLTASKMDHMLDNTKQSMCHLSKEIEKGKLFLNDEGYHPFMWSQPKIFRSISDCFLNHIE